MNKAMTLLYVITDLEVGGVPLHLERLVCAMRDRSIRPVVVSLYPSGPVGRRLGESGVEVLSCRGRGGRDLGVVRRLAAIMRHTKPTLVHSFLFHANLAARLAAPLAHIRTDRILCEIQTVEVQQKWHLIVEHFTQHLCRMTIGNSPSVVQHLAAHAAIDPEKLRLVPGGIDPHPCRIAQKPFPVPEKTTPQQRTVLFVGRLDKVKGLDPLLQAFGRLGRQANARLLLAGDGPERGRLEQRAAALSLTHRVHFLGMRNDVVALLQSADVFAFPSRSEGLPNALLEAMACECAIVTTDVPGCRDLIAHQHTGLLVPYGNATLLADAITRLIADPELGRRLGANARREVEKHWRFDQMIRSYQSLYRETLEETA